MYKAKKRWMVAGITMFSTALGMGTISTANADNVQNVNVNSTSSVSLKENNNSSSNSSVSQNNDSNANNKFQNISNSEQNNTAYNQQVENRHVEIQKVTPKNNKLPNLENNDNVSISEQNNPAYDKQVQTRSTKLKQQPEKVATPTTPKENSEQQSNSNNQSESMNISQKFAATPQARDAQTNVTFGSCNELNQVVVDLKNPVSGDLNSQIQFNNGGGIKNISQNGNQLTITTKNDIDFQKVMTVTVDGQQYTIDPTDGTAMPVVRSQAFDNKYVYNGNDLGVTYTKDATTFKIYAPTSSGMSVNLFENDTDPNAKLKSWTPMTFDPNTGVWTTTIKGDLKDTAYNYHQEFANGKAYDLYDPYATACVEGGFRSVVLSPDEMGPAVTAGKVIDKNDPTDEVIGEIHVRDFTNDPSSGVSANLRGTYLGAVQPNTTDSKGNPTGLNYLLHQGINTVQIQPMYQYDDDGNNTNKTYQYDWGYDPENYNVPEGWYSTNRDDPATRIKECKEMVQGFHNAGIRVNMDVVYNHIADHNTNALAKSVPGYYFRYGNDGNLTNASACGNDIASERPMVRNYILHSVKYWHDEYGIDGFRFDLMGNLDVETMNDIRKELPDVVLYGEGWNMGANIPDNQKADQANENQMPTIGSFNGWGRDVIRGSDDGNNKGYITGNQSQQTMSQLGNFIYGCQNLSNTPNDAVDGGVNYVNPSQVINYTECHDNKTLYDTIRAAYPNENPDVSMRRAELANAITILNEGVPFVQVGQGFGRSKNGDGNSYRSGDAVNNIHWDTQDDRTWATAYEKALIQLRNSDPAFRMTTYSDMNNNMKWVEVGSNNGVIGYELTSPSTGKKYIIGYSNNASSQDLTGIPNGNWKVLIKNCNGYLDNPQTINVTDGKTDIPSLSCLVLEQDPQIDNELQVTYQDANGNKVGDYSEGGSKALGDTNSIAQQHVPSGYHFVKIVSSKNSSNVANNVQHNTTTIVVEVAKDHPIMPPTTDSKPSTGTTTTEKPSQGGSSSSSTDADKPTSGSTTDSQPTGDNNGGNTSNVSKYVYTITYFDGNTGSQVGGASFSSNSKLSNSQLADKVQSETKDKVDSYNVDQDDVDGDTEKISVIATVAKNQTSPTTYNYTVAYFDGNTGAQIGTTSFSSNNKLTDSQLADKVQAGVKNKVSSYNVDEDQVTTDGSADNISIVAIVAGDTNSSSSQDGSSSSSTDAKPSQGESSSSSTDTDKPSQGESSSSSTDTNKPSQGESSGSSTDAEKPSSVNPSDKPSTGNTGSSSSSSTDKPTDNSSSSKPSQNKPNDNGSSSASDGTHSMSKPNAGNTDADHNSGKVDDHSSQDENSSQGGKIDHETEETGNETTSEIGSVMKDEENKQHEHQEPGTPVDITPNATVDSGKSHDELTGDGKPTDVKATNNVTSQSEAKAGVQENTQASVKAEKLGTAKAIEQDKNSSNNGSGSQSSSDVASNVSSSKAVQSSKGTTDAKAESSQQSLPQTGENNNQNAAKIGLAMLGVVGTIGIGIRRKRYGI